MTDSQSVLAKHVQTGSDVAFRELVACYVDLVYSTALRLVLKTKKKTMKTLISSAAMMGALTLNAQTGSGSLYIHSSANIYGAMSTNIYQTGHAPPAPGGGGAGSWPSSFFFPAAVHVMLFTNVSGSISLSSSLGALNNADGNSSFSTDISSFGGLSGIRCDASGFLVGVFLGSAEPTNPAPTTLDFGTSGLGTSFPSLSPQIGQLFFIGDGLTGTGSGSVQQFFPPATATRFYMGFSDAPGYTGLPGQYQDNVGSLIAGFRWQPVPKVTIIHSGADLILTWPTNAFEFSLQSTTDLGSSAVWTTVVPAPVVVNGKNTVTNLLAASQQFYRLSR